MRFNDWLRGKNRNDDEIEYYEDTHDEHGNYIGRQTTSVQSQRQLHQQSLQQQIQTPQTSQNQKIFVAANVPGGTKSFGNIVVYRPATIEEVEALITFLKHGEPAVSNLNGLDEGDAQRILDFLSGAIFALGGNIHRISDNIFLLSPQGVEIQSHYDKVPPQKAKSGDKN